MTKDGGKTWNLLSYPNHFYRKTDVAIKNVQHMNDYYRSRAATMLEEASELALWQCRAVKYVPGEIVFSEPLSEFKQRKPFLI